MARKGRRARPRSASGFQRRDGAGTLHRWKPQRTPVRPGSTESTGGHLEEKVVDRVEDLLPYRAAPPSPG